LLSSTSWFWDEVEDEDRDKNRIENELETGLVAWCDW